MNGMITKTYKPGPMTSWQQKKVTILLPHAADYRWMLRTFPSLGKYMTDSFIDYLRIEQDFGSEELAHYTAQELNRRGIEVEVVKTAYNRGLLDGGRYPDWALRSALPSVFKEKNSTQLLRLHKTTTELISEKCLLTEASGGFVIDLHTMAPKNPTFTLEEHEHPSHETITEYVEAFCRKEPFQEYRPVDILTKDEHGNQVTDEKLSKLIHNVFVENGFTASFNEPYSNHTRYMMNHYLSISSGVAIDIPKHLIAEGSTTDFSLKSFDLCYEKIKTISKLIAEATFERFNE
jgi:hypothetical protein